jgi:uncharacterized protein YggU (UPF0235/DUF167 family)
MAKRPDSPQVSRITVKVAAGAANSAINGWRDQCLRVRLSTAPERGKANAALVALLAQALARDYSG